MGLSPSIVASAILVLQISHNRPLYIVPNMGIQVPPSLLIVGAWLCKYQASLVPLFRTNCPHCESVMAIGATNSLLKNFANCCINVANVIVLNDSSKSWDADTSHKRICEKFTCDPILVFRCYLSFSLMLQVDRTKAPG